MQCKQRLEAYLREHQVPYELQHHAQAYRALKIAAAEHITGKMMAKTVIVLADGRMRALVLSATDQVDIHQVQARLAAHEVRLAHEAEFAATFPDCDVGTMPPFGNLYGLPVSVEQSLAKEETIVFPVGTPTDTMRLAYADFEHLVAPDVFAFAQAPSTVETL